MRNARHLLRDGLALLAAVVVVIAVFAWFRQHPSSGHAHASRAINATTTIESSMVDFSGVASAPAVAGQERPTRPR